MMAKTKRLANSIIKIVIRPIWPRKKDIKFRNVFYICEKVRQMLPLLDYNAGYNSFSEIFNNRILLDGIDDQIELDDDLANELAKDIWTVVLRYNMDNPDSTLTFSQYTKPISANAKYFFYELALDDRRKVNGVVWQTSTMRANFEIFGSFISLGTTKRAINKWIWLYMSARLYSEHRKMCLACEGIVCG